MNERQHKVILIGAKGYERTVDDRRIDCFQWQELRKIPNIRDYDLVILDLLAFNLEESSRDEVDWAAFVRLLDFHSAMDILQHQGRIIVVGDPRFTIQIKGPQVIQTRISQMEFPFEYNKTTFGHINKGFSSCWGT